MAKRLRTVLSAYALHDPALGYCQSLNSIAALLLIQFHPQLDENDVEDASDVKLDSTSEDDPATYANLLVNSVDNDEESTTASPDFTPIPPPSDVSSDDREMVNDTSDMSALERCFWYDNVDMP